MRAEIECLGRCMTAVESLDGSDVIKAYFHLAEDSEIFVATQVSVVGTKYKENLFVATVVVNDVPKFALIRSILMCGRTSTLYLKSTTIWGLWRIFMPMK